MSVVLSILALVGIIIGLVFWVTAFRASVQSYRSPLREVDLWPEQPATSTQTSKVVIVLISGLGYDASLTLDLPVLEQLKQIGANAAVQSAPPTFSQIAWATLMSGATPETNDAPPVDMQIEDLRLLEVDTIFARAHAANLKTALLGQADWRRLIPRNHLDYTFFVEEPSPEADQSILEAALSILENEAPELVLIQFSQVDVVAQQQGSTSQAAHQAAGRIEAYLEQIRAAIDPKHTILAVVSDHGHISSGGHGGDEPAVIWQPFVLVGENVHPGNYSDIHQTDIAPTITALLGVAPPGAARGNILFEMLRLDEYERVVAQLLLAQQRTKLAEAYVSAIKGEATLPETLMADLAQAQTALANNNLDGAFQLALLAQQEADAQMAAARNSRARIEQLPRLVLAGLMIFLGLNVIWRRRGLHAGSIIMAAMAAIALYHGLYQLQGHSYSLSSVAGDLTEFPFAVARRVAVSLLAGGGLLLVFLMLTDEANWLTLLGTGYGFSVLVAFVFMLPFFWGYWQNGLVITWHLPSVGPVFWQLSSAFEAMSVAVLGLILPWPIMILSLFINLIRRRLSATRAQTAEPGPWRGLRL
ncbi:MAG: alkaline phosphatase family protein [Anaerolineae bacterium]|nr:alkaline phosphatase family protein [Anaerolineae bacterium]